MIPRNAPSRAGDKGRSGSFFETESLKLLNQGLEKMGVEEISATMMIAEPSETAILPISNPNPKVLVSNEYDEPEEGEIVNDEESSMAKSTETALQPHPLEYSWTFWFDNPYNKSKQASWGSSMRSVFTVGTVEEFWSIFNNIHQPSKLVVGADLHCFKHMIEPKWEDPICANGGKWTMTFGRGKADTAWLYTLLAMIGEQFDHGEKICGAVVSVRSKQERIAIWTKNALDEAAQISIGKQWKKCIDYNEPMHYIVHEDAKMLERSAKNKYSI